MYMVPSSDRKCHLDRRWRQIFASKNLEGIKGTLRRAQLLGPHSLNDTAWLIPVKGQEFLCTLKKDDGWLEYRVH